MTSDAAAAKELYGFRCSLLHQGRARPHGGHYPIAFTEPDPTGIGINGISTQAQDGSRIQWIDIPGFVQSVCVSVEGWIEQMGNTNAVQRNMARFVKRYPNGIAGHYEGPVIA